MTVITTTHERTDHAEQIRAARTDANLLERHGHDGHLERRAAAVLLQMHDDTGISLDNQPDLRRFVEAYVGPIIENGV